jgi:transcriptional regulator with XRE-family HTH domain
MQIPEEQWKIIEEVHKWTCERMKRIRLARGFTQDHLAKLLGHKGAGSRVSDFENARNDWKGSTLLRHARFLGINMDRVFVGAPRWDRKQDDVVIVSRDALRSILSRHINEDKVVEIMEGIEELEESTSI